MDRYGSPRPTIFLAVAANFLVCRILEGVTNRRLVRLPLSGADVFNVVLFSVRSFCSVGSGRYESGNLGVRYTEGGFRYCVLVAIHTEIEALSMNYVLVDRRCMICRCTRPF